MNIVAINTVDYGSTGRIMLETAKCARDKGYQYHTYSVARRDRKKPPEGHTYYMSYFGYMIHYALGKATGANGFFSVIPTIRLIVSINKQKPDIIHLHNIHGFNVNISLLFSYLRKSKARVFWTLHDCWAFTGHCAHYDMIGCTKWQAGCCKCPVYKDYPESVIDNSKWMWKYKRKRFTDIPELQIITPSRWLETQVKHSFLQDKKVRTIHNGINLECFQPRDSNFRRHYHLEGKYIVLGVAFGWGKKKGLDVFQKLAEMLPNNYTVVLVGTTEKTDAILNHRIISIHRTTDQSELCNIYSAANVFVNPTREDTFPTVNIEALACGTPVITFRTGGSPEILDQSCGIVVDKNDEQAIRREIIRVCETQPFSSEECVKRAAYFDAQRCYNEYVSLYKQQMETD